MHGIQAHVLTVPMKIQDYEFSGSLACHAARLENPEENQKHKEEN
jgi:hypothetical protein